MKQKNWAHLNTQFGVIENIGDDFLDVKTNTGDERIMYPKFIVPSHNQPKIGQEIEIHLLINKKNKSKKYVIDLLELTSPSDGIVRDVFDEFNIS